MRSGFGVRRLFTFVACLLAVLWLPATLHCGLEAAGFLGHDHEEVPAENDCAHACFNDSCAAVEDGAYKRSAGLVKLEAPVLTLWLAGWVERARAPEWIAPLSPDTTDSPPELARTWQFTARTALLPGAPSVLA